MAIDRSLQKDLMRSLKSGVSTQINTSYERIYFEYHRLIFHIVLSIISYREAAEDIVMETFTRLYENIPNLDPTRNLKYWLIATAKHLALDYQKRNIMQQSSLVEDLDQTHTDCFESTRWKDFLSEFGETLSEDELDILVLHVVYRMTFKEISEYKDASLHSISARYRRAILKIRQFYKKEGIANGINS